MSESSLKIIIPVATAVLGFIFSYFLQKLKERKEPRHRLTWTATTQQGVVQAIPDVLEEILVTYKGSPVKELVAVKCSIKNTGNRVIKNHLIRFEFPENCNIIDSTLTPKPQRELGVLRNVAKEEGSNEVVYEVAHLEKGQEISVKILASGEQANRWEIYSFNDAGDIEFQPREALKRKEDSEHLVPFFQYAMTMIIIYMITAPLHEYALVPEITFLFEGAIAIILGAHINPVARTIRDRWWTRDSSRQNSSSITVYGGVDHFEHKTYPNIE